MTVVAKTSKNPSTHRWTTHQRQYSTIDRCVCWPQVERRRRRSRPMAAVEMRNSISSGRLLAALSAAPARMPRTIRNEPEQQADEQGDLPGSAEVDVLVALWPK